MVPVPVPLMSSDPVLCIPSLLLSLSAVFLSLSRSYNCLSFINIAYFNSSCRLSTGSATIPSRFGEKVTLEIGYKSLEKSPDPTIGSLP